MPRKIEIPNLKRACIGFPDKELEQIDEIAEKEGKTRTGLIRDKIRQALGIKPVKAEPKSRPPERFPEDLGDCEEDLY